MKKNLDYYKIFMILIVTGIILLAGFLLIKVKTTPTTSLTPIKTVKQGDFSQGVLVLNTDKSDYLPGEKMMVSMASLDTAGHTLCKSNLKLELTDPQNQTQTLKIISSPTCGNDNVTNDADYLASQTLEKSGQYNLKLTNLDTNKTTETAVQVASSLTFDVKRAGATRINPFKSDRYPMIITVKANQDYHGQITEQIPADFKIIWQGSSQITQQAGHQTLTWNANLKKGEIKEFKYEYTAPKVSPELYKFGPVTINGQQTGNVWQIASDSTFGLSSTGSTTYPTTNIGNTNTGTGAFSANYDVLDKYSTSFPMTAIEIHTRGTASGNVKVNLFSDSSGPSSKLLTTVAGAVTGSSWKTFTVGPYYLPTASYWLSAKTDTAQGITYTSTTGGTSDYKSNTYANDFATSGWTTGRTNQDSTYFVGVRIEGYAKATKATLSNLNATLSSVSFYSHATGNIRLAILSDSSGHPGSLLWESASTAVSAAAWTTINISSGSPSSLSLTNATYWLAWQSDSANLGPSYTAGAASSGNYITQAYGAYPAGSGWGAGTATAENWSEYVTYTAVCTWAGGTSTDWATGSNWDGCTGAGGVPATTDSVIIQTGTTYAPTLTTSVTIAGLTVNSGTLTMGASGALTINGNVTLAGGTLNAGSDSISLTGNWTNNGGTFTQGTSTVTFTGTGAQAINGTAASQTFSTLVVGMTAGQTLSVSGSTTTLSVANFTETTGNFTPPATMNISGNATYTAGTFTAGSGTVLYTTTTGGQQVAALTYNSLTLSNTSGTDTAQGAITSNGTFTTTAGGTLDMGTNTLSVSTVSHSGILKTQNTSGTPITTGKTWGGTVNYNSSSAQTISSGTYNILKVNNTAGAILGAGTTITTLTIGDVTGSSIFNDGGYTITPGASSVLNLTSGTYNLGSSGTATTWPAWSTPTINAGTTVGYISGQSQTVSTTPSYANVAYSGAGTKTVAAGGTLSVTGNFSTTGGTAIFTTTANLTVTGNITGDGAITMGSGTITIGGNWTNNGSFTKGTSLVNYNTATGGQTVAGLSYNSLTLSNTSGTDTASGAITVGATFTTSASGTLEMGTNALSVSTVSHSGIINTQNTTATPITTGKTWGGTVNFNGSSGQTIPAGTYSTLKVNNAAGATLGAGVTLTNLTIGDVTSSSIFADGGYTITLSGTTTLTESNGADYQLGSAGTATTWLGWNTATLNSGTTVEYASGVAQAVSITPSYQNLTFSGAGTKTPAAGTLTVGGNWTIGSAAALNTNNNIANVTGNIAGTANLTTGTGLITLGGNWTNTGTLTCGTGGVTFSGGSGTQITGPAGGITFTTLTINKAIANNNAGTITVSTALNGSNTLTQGSGATLTLNFTGALGITGLNASSNTNTVNYTYGGDQTVKAVGYSTLVLGTSGTKTMTGVTTIGALTISGSAVMTGNAAFTVSGAFTYSSSGSTTLTGSTNISIGSMNLSNGVLNDNGVTITVTGSSTPWTKSGGTFTTSGTTVFSANADITTLLSGTVNFNNLSFLPTLTNDHSYTFGVTPTIAGNFTINPSGAYRLTAYLSGDTIVSGTTNLSGTSSGTSTLDTVNGVNRAFTTGILTIDTGGTFTARNSAIAINGTSTTIFSQAGTFNAGGSTVTVSGSGALSLTSATTFNSLTVTGVPTTANNFAINGALIVSGSGNLSPSGGTVTMANGSTITNSATLAFSGITFSGTTTSGSSFNVKGDWTNNGTFNQSAGIVTFNGAGTQQLTGTNNNFFGLSITAASSRTVFITAGSTLSIANNGSLNFQGPNAINRLVLRSDGADWNLHLSTTGTSQAVSYVAVAHSNAAGYQQINAANGTNANQLNNTNWVFDAAEFDFNSLNMNGINLN